MSNLSRLAALGALRDSDVILRAGMRRWMAARAVPGLPDGDAGASRATPQAAMHALLPEPSRAPPVPRLSELYSRLQGDGSRTAASQLPYITAPAPSGASAAPVEEQSFVASIGAALRATLPGATLGGATALEPAE